MAPEAEKDLFKHLVYLLALDSEQLKRDMSRSDCDKSIPGPLACLALALRFLAQMEAEFCLEAIEYCVLCRRYELQTQQDRSNEQRIQGLHRSKCLPPNLLSLVEEFVETKSRVVVGREIVAEYLDPDRLGSLAGGCAEVQKAVRCAKAELWQDGLFCSGLQTTTRVLEDSWRRFRAAGRDFDVFPNEPCGTSGHFARMHPHWLRRVGVTSITFAL